jgi:hypothetical protein
MVQCAARKVAIGRSETSRRRTGNAAEDLARVFEDLFLLLAERREVFHIDAAGTDLMTFADQGPNLVGMALRVGCWHEEQVR